MRRASTVLINPGRPETPDQDRGSSTDIERSEDDAASTTGKKPKKSRSNTSLSGLFKRAPSPPPPQPGAPAEGGANQPSPIAESPLREAAASQEETPVPGAVKSPLSQEVKLAATSSADPDPDPAAQPLSPTPAGYIPPPLVDNTAGNPGAFIDDVDDLPSSDPIPDPYKQPAQAQPQPAPEQGPTLEGAPSERTNPSPIPTAHDSTDLLVSSGGEQERASDTSAPIPIPQSDRGTFFEHLRASPEDHDEALPVTTKELDLESEELPTGQREPEEEHQAPMTPPRQVFLDTYTEELDHEPWSGGEPGAGQRSIVETPMSIPPRPVARSLTSSDTSEEYVTHVCFESCEGLI